MYKRPAGPDRPTRSAVPCRFAVPVLSVGRTRAVVPAAPVQEAHASSEASSSSVSFGGCFYEMTVYELFAKFYAFEFQRLNVLFDATVQRHLDLPWTREYFGILDRRFVHQVIRRERRVPLYHMQRVAVEVAGAVEPSFIVLGGHIDDERIAVPASNGPAHP